MPAVLHAQTRHQIEALALAADRPLLIVDADEVLVMFMEAFEAFMDARALYFDWKAFRLTGNVRRKTDQQPISADAVTDLLDCFYQQRTAQIGAVPGAAEALASLNAQAQIVILSNISMAHKAARQQGLARQGMAYPVVANSGLKGPAVRHLATRGGKPAFFIDDSPRHHESVASHADHVHRVHFVHDRRLAELAGPAPASHYHSTDWSVTQSWIEGRLDDASTGHD